MSPTELTDTTAPTSTTTGTTATTPATPATTQSGAGTQFTMATFNLLGSSHTAQGGHSPGMASGVARMPGALQILAQHQVSVAGLQEFQPDQRAAFQRQATGWAMYPGLSMRRKAGENSVAWRTDTWDLVKTGLVNITYFNGRERPMPYVLLQEQGDRRAGVLLDLPQPGQHRRQHAALAHRGDDRARSSCSTTSRRPASRSSSPVT